MLASVRGRGAERGVALLMTLVVVAALSSVAVAMSDTLMIAARRSSNAAARDQALWHLQGAEALARQVLIRDFEESPTRTSFNAPWARGVSFEIDGGRIDGAVRDRSNCFNLNSLVTPGERGGLVAVSQAREELVALAVALGAHRADAARLAAAASDWIDADQSPIGGGAEDFDYGVLEPPYRAANTLFVEVEETRALAGVDEALFRALRQHLCAHPETAPSTLNVNTLRAEDAALLVALFGGAFTLDTVRDVIAERPAGGWSSAEEFWALDAVRQYVAPEAVRARVGVTTRYFEVQARVFHRQAYAESATLFQRSGGIALAVHRRIGSGE